MAHLAIISRDLGRFRQALLADPTCKHSTKLDILGRTIQAKWDLGVEAALQFGCRSTSKANLVAIIQSDSCMVTILTHLMAVPKERTYLRHLSTKRMSPLSLAVSLHRVALIPILLHAGSHSTHISHEIQTPFIIACKTGQLDAVRLLAVERPWMITVRCQHQSGLEMAILHHHLDIVAFLIQLQPNLLNASRGAMPPLHYAVRNGSAEIVEWMCARASPEQMAVPFTGHSLVETSIQSNRPDWSAVAMVLVRANAPKWDTLAVMQRTMEVQSEPLFRLLFETGTSMLRYAHTQERVFYMAVKNGAIEILRYLVAHSQLDEMILECDHAAMVHAAAEGGHISTLRYLHQLGFPVDLPTFHDKHTPMHMAASKGNVAMMDVILECYLEQTHQTRESITSFFEPISHTGQTPLESAAITGHADATVWLLRHGCSYRPSPSERSLLLFGNWFRESESTLVALIFQAIEGDSTMSEADILDYRFVVYFIPSLLESVLVWC